MLYVFFLLIPVIFVLVAALCAFAVFGGAPTVRRAAYRVIYGSSITALILAALLAWIAYQSNG
jgi:hypothetical protein